MNIKRFISTTLLTENIQLKSSTLSEFFKLQLFQIKLNPIFGKICTPHSREEPKIV